MAETLRGNDDERQRFHGKVQRIMPTSDLDWVLNATYVQAVQSEHIGAIYDRAGGRYDEEGAEALGDALRTEVRVRRFMSNLFGGLDLDEGWSEF